MPPRAPKPTTVRAARIRITRPGLPEFTSRETMPAALAASCGMRGIASVSATRCARTASSQFDIASGGDAAAGSSAVAGSLFGRHAVRRLLGPGSSKEHPKENRNDGRQEKTNSSGQCIAHRGQFSVDNATRRSRNRTNDAGSNAEPCYLTTSNSPGRQVLSNQGSSSRHTELISPQYID